MDSPGCGTDKNINKLNHLSCLLWEADVGFSSWLLTGGRKEDSSPAVWRQGWSPEFISVDLLLSLIMSEQFVATGKSSLGLSVLPCELGIVPSLSLS